MRRSVFAELRFVRADPVVSARGRDVVAESAVALLFHFQSAAGKSHGDETFIFRAFRFEFGHAAFDARDAAAFAGVRRRAAVGQFVFVDAGELDLQLLLSEREDLERAGLAFPSAVDLRGRDDFRFRQDNRLGNQGSEPKNA